MVDWLKKAPNSIIITMIIVCGFLAAMVVLSFVLLQLNGQDTTQFRQWVQTLGQILVYPFLGITATASIQAARSSSNAEDQTNGQLAARDAEIARLRAQVTALGGKP
jgi:predicted permease